MREFRWVIEKNPKHVQAHNNLAEVLRNQGKYPEALVECRAAMEINPEFPDAHRTMGSLLLANNDLDGAVEQFQTALKLRPDDPLAQAGLADAYSRQTDALWRQGKFREGWEHLKQLAALQPPNVPITTEIVRNFINDRRPEARSGADAVEVASRLCAATEYKDIFALEVLAGAYAEAGDFAQAEAAIRKAMETPLGQRPSNAAVLQNRIALYRAHQTPVIPPPKL